jgi:hypothetical protein
LALIVEAPLEEAANPMVTPNPAKAPWYFLGLQELVGYSALIGGVVLPGLVVAGLAAIPFIDRDRRGVGRWLADGSGRRYGLVGAIYGLITTAGAVALGVLVPMRGLFPGVESQLFFDLVNPATLLLALFGLLYLAVWRQTRSTRYAAIATFCAFIVAFALLTYTGTALRGPNWDFYWPWQPWPQHSTAY